MSQLLPADSHRSIRKACHLLHEGEVIAFPSDMGYYLAVNVFDRYALRQLITLTGQPREQGLLVLIYQIDDLTQVARGIANAAWPLLRAFWPGSLIVRLLKSSQLPDEVTGGGPTVAVRSPEHPLSLDLVIEYGHPLAVTPAVQAGRPAPSTAWHVRKLFGDDVPVILDGPVTGPITPAILDLSVTPPHLVQPGPLDPAELKRFLPDLTGPDRFPPLSLP